MQTIPRKTSPRRIGLILLLGALSINALIGYKIFNMPQPAPDTLQTSGQNIIQAELKIISNSAFGRSKRGQIIITEIQRLLDEDQIIFSSDLNGPRGLTCTPLFGPKRIYIKVLEMNHGKFLHQLPWQLSEALFHEAVHSLNKSFHGNSIEEECDAFMAGAFAESVSRNITPPTILQMDGIPIIRFVKQSYPAISHNPRYQPIGITLEQLKQRTGLK